MDQSVTFVITEDHWDENFDDVSSFKIYFWWKMLY